MILKALSLLVTEQPFICRENIEGLVRDLDFGRLNADPPFHFRQERVLFYAVSLKSQAKGHNQGVRQLSCSKRICKDV